MHLNVFFFCLLHKCCICIRFSVTLLLCHYTIHLQESVMLCMYKNICIHIQTYISMHFSFLLFKIFYTHMRKKNVFIFLTAFFYSKIKQNFHLLKRGAFSDVVDAVFFISSLSSVSLDFSLFVNFHPLFYFSLTCCTSIFIYFFLQILYYI